MQTQVQQSSKKNKVTVPFYRPSYRLYEQTSADIIKEARAAVMTSSPVGIKPVFTSRPFTPNQKERTLFGNVKKNKSRPPSSFSLRPIKNQESSSRVKLPSITVVSTRKDYSTFRYSKNLSLDNLTENYDAEISEKVISNARGNSTASTKSHSCPKERRLLKVASMSDLRGSFINNNNYKKELEFYEKETTNINQDDYNAKINCFFGDYVKLEQNVNHSEQYQKNPVLTKGGGDYEILQDTTENPSSANRNCKTDENEAVPIGNLYVKYKQESGNSKEKKVEQENKIIKPTETNEKTVFVVHDPIEKSKSLGEGAIGTTTEKNFERNRNSYTHNKVEEKSIVTGSKSEYLMSLQRTYKNYEINKKTETVPLEILELYETARYYGVDFDESGSRCLSQSEKSSPGALCTSENFAQKFLEKSNNKCQGVEDFEEEKNGNTKKPRKLENSTSSDNGEYIMNNKKRYHLVCDKTETKEKAYKKWSNKNQTNVTVPQRDVSNESWDLFWKNSYYTDKEEAQEKKEDTGSSGLRRLLNRITGLIKEGAGNKEIYETTSELYDLFKNNKIILDNNLKESISRALYLYVDNESAEVLLSLAKVFFQLKEENSLSVACKIIFKVARFDTNDHLFLNEEDILELFLEGIGRASPLDCAESCIYSYGALKFLTLNHDILSRILHMGALDLMTLHLKIINNAYDENSNVGEQTQHVLFQLTGALRNVAAGEGALPLFLTTNCITILCKTLRNFNKDEDVIVNISRTLSLLSTDEIVTQSLMQIDNILTTLIELMERYKENDKILIRLAFCLGNIVEHSDLARVQLSRSDTSLNILLNVLKLYIDKDLEISLKEENRSNSSSEVIDDVIVKIIRIIANMSMNPIVGSNLSPATKEKKSLQLSKLLSVLLIRKDPGITLLATLGCLNNISYYCNTHSALVDITQGVERVLGLESVECQIESARVLGNLTRHREIRDLIYSTGGVDLLMKLLSSPDQEVVRCACGALVNMMLDSETRKSFVEAQGINQLVNALEVFPGDWSLASLATRAIWNACGNDLSSAMLNNNVEHLLSFLASSLEEENWNDGDVMWEEFASVATDLLEKISSHLEST